MNIKIGKHQVSMLNPPNEGEVSLNGKLWRIGRAYNGMIMLRSHDMTEVHPDFLPDGMWMNEFCQWINQQYDGKGLNIL